MPSLGESATAVREVGACAQLADADAAREQLVDAVAAASSALVAVAARSLAHLAEDVTLAQYRVLVELSVRERLRAAELAVALSADRSTVTRMCERLVRKRLVQRRRERADRRAVRLALTPAGRRLVHEVTRRRRAEVARIVASIPQEGRLQVLVALRAFADAAGEARAQDWATGWDLER